MAETTDPHANEPEDIDAPVAARVAELAQLLETHRAAYYAGHPTISDAAFDALEDELRALRPTHPALGKVGAAPAVTEWEKARHDIPMGSLNKVVSAEELHGWLDRCNELAAKDGLGPIGTLFVAEKLDGISIEVIYRGGKLVDAISRGDGEVGERITPNVARMRGVPRRIKDARPMSVRGEIILRLSDMKAHFTTGTSPRNLAAGTSKRFDGQGAEHLTVLFYDLADHLDVHTETEKFELLRSLGFNTPNTGSGGVEDVLALYDRYAGGVRAGLDYEIDGLVVYVDSLHVQTLLGEVNRRPRGAVAFKFPSPAKVTEVIDISWDTGPSGRVTPVAIVAPVELAGAKVQRASLHNAANVNKLGIGKGDRVLVSRRNDVIPYVEEVVEKHGAPALAPTACPVCRAALSPEGEYLICRNTSCPAIAEGRITNWIHAIGALEWGDKLVAQVVQTGLVREPRDLYSLTSASIAGLEKQGEKAVKLGEKTAKNCIDQLHSRLPIPLPVFVDALGMDNFALQTAKLLVQNGYRTIEAMCEAKQEDLAAINGLGPIKAASIVRGLASRRDEIRRLLDAGIVPVTPEEEGPLAGLSFCFTGASSRPRAELTEMVESLGGRALTSVTKELRYLVLADPESTSSKAAKARKYGTKLITEEGLMALIEERKRAAESAPLP